jgi:hypothetical protein
MRTPPRIMLPSPGSNARPTNADTSWLVWILVVGILVVAALSKEIILPRYFFFDSGTIDTFIAVRSKFTPGDSYSSTAAIFGLVGLRQSSALLPVLTSLIVVPALLWGVCKARRTAIRLRELVIFGFFGFMAVVYMTTLSKDLIVLILVMFFLARPKRHRWLSLALWAGLAVVYGYYFRPYWFLVLPLALALRVFFTRVRRPVLIAPAILFLLLMFAFALQVKLGMSADAFRTAVNDVRIGTGETNARTMITPFVQGGSFASGYVNVCLTLAALIMPAPLLLTVSPYYIAIFVFISVLQVSFWMSFGKAVRNGTDIFVIECACLVAAFVAIQSMFEPDYGSYVRHLSPFYPLMFYIWLRESRSDISSSLPSGLAQPEPTRRHARGALSR